VERVAGTLYISRSARLRDLLVYLCDRVLVDGADEIHEQEAGHKVFGRPPDYDTASDNIVRVHASTLRKRLEQYFPTEGRDEPVIIELPKGNYAPVFRERTALPAAAGSFEAPQPSRTGWKLWILTALVILLGGAIVFLLLRPERTSGTRALWSQIFQPAQQTDIVLDDASLGLYQELTGRSIGLSNYFDRDYLR